MESACISSTKSLVDQNAWFVTNGVAQKWCNTSMLRYSFILFYRFCFSFINPVPCRDTQEAFSPKRAVYGTTTVLNNLLRVRTEEKQTWKSILYVFQMKDWTISLNLVAFNFWDKIDKKNFRFVAGSIILRQHFPYKSKPYFYWRDTLSNQFNFKTFVF